MARRTEPDGRGEPPTASVLLSGGLGVVAVVAFVAALVFGVEVKNPPPGARLGLTSSAGPAGLAVLVPRCRSERVTAVELRDGEGSTLWRLSARKGGIDERYEVGAEKTPFGFTLDEPFVPPLPEGALTVVVALDGEPFDTVDRLGLNADDVPRVGVAHLGVVVDPATFEARAVTAADCQGPGRDLGLVNGLFVLAAAGVVVSYLVMVARYLRSRSG